MAPRVETLDLIRGVAVLGILAVNIAGFAGPSAATLTPHVPHAASMADELAFAVVFVVFEGKMRALFTLLFGASMVLFIERADDAGHVGEVLQLRRLAWLLAFGAAHYFLFWWGDILFIYAAAGILALFLRDLPPRMILVGAVLFYLGWHLAGMLEQLSALRAEEQVRLGTASAREARLHGDFLTAFFDRAARELAEFRMGFGAQAATKLIERPHWPLQMTWSNIGETLPLILIGMALQQSGFFAGRWPPRRMWGLAAGGLVLGLAITLPMLAWLWERHFPPRAMSVAILYGTAVPRLAMGLAYAALLALATPRLLRTAIGRRLSAAGRMALTNYVATTAVMTAIFYGWGLGWIGRFGQAEQLVFVLLGWALMIGWSAAWLARFRQGPLEWTWRSLTEGRTVAFRR